MKKKGKIILFASIGVVVVAAAVILTMMLSGGHRVIKVESFDGDVVLERDSDEKDIVEGMNLKSEDTITTGDDGLIELLVDSDKHILARENTCFKIVSSGTEKAGKLKIKLEYGTSLIEIENKLNDDSTVEVKTPNASLSVRGTTFEVSYSEEDDTTTVNVTEGVVEVECGDEKEKVSEGECAILTEESIVVEEIQADIDEEDEEESGNATDGEYTGAVEPDDTDDEEDIVTSTKLPEGALDYSDDVAFEARDLEGNFGYGVFVKNLDEWEHEISYVGDIVINELVRGDVRVRYWIQTADEINDNLDYLAEEDYLMSVDYLKNDDGDTIITAIDGGTNEDGSLFVSYRYCKPLGDDLYVTLNVFSLDDKKIVGSMDIREFLPLTEDCYYIIEEPQEAVPGLEDDIAVGPYFPLEEVDPSLYIASTEVPELFRGDVTLEELQFALRAMETTRLTQEYPALKHGLEIIYYEPVLGLVYGPIDGNERSYDINELNRLFSPITGDMIYPDTIPEMATIEGNVLTFEPCTEAQESRIMVRILRIYYAEDGYICVDFNFKQLHDPEGNSWREGVTAAFFFSDEDEGGKYRLGYLMERDSREVNANE